MNVFYHVPAVHPTDGLCLSLSAAWPAANCRNGVGTPATTTTAVGPVAWIAAAAIATATRRARDHSPGPIDRDFTIAFKRSAATSTAAAAAACWRCRRRVHCRHRYSTSGQTGTTARNVAVSLVAIGFVTSPVVDGRSRLDEDVTFYTNIFPGARVVAPTAATTLNAIVNTAAAAIPYVGRLSPGQQSSLVTRGSLQKVDGRDTQSLQEKKL